MGVRGTSVRDVKMGGCELHGESDRSTWCVMAGRGARESPYTWYTVPRDVTHVLLPCSMWGC